MSQLTSTGNASKFLKSCKANPLSILYDQREVSLTRIPVEIDFGVVWPDWGLKVILYLKCKEEA
jgi:hypothetical protein